VAKVKAMLLDTLDDAAGALRSSGRAVRLAQAYLNQRERLDHARLLLHTIARPADHEIVLREAQRAYMRRVDFFIDAPNPSSLARAWTTVLIEAAEKVERDRRDADVYAAVAATPSDDDREWSEAAARAAGEHWREN
jgi:hypothetical protein